MTAAGRYGAGLWIQCMKLSKKYESSMLAIIVVGRHETKILIFLNVFVPVFLTFVARLCCLMFVS